MKIDSIEKAEDFVKNLKRSDNWVSNEELLTKLNDSYKIILDNSRDDLIPFVTVNLALYYIDLGEYGQAWEYTEAARKYAEKFENYDCLLNAISLQFRVQLYLGNLEKTQEILNEQLEFAIEFNDNIQLHSVFLNKAFQYHLLQNKNDCLTAFEQAILHILKSKNNYYIARTYINYAGYLMEFKEYIKAKENLKIGNEIAQKYNYIKLLSLSFTNFGFLYSIEEKFSKAITFYKKAIYYCQQQNNTNDIVQIKIMLAEIYLKVEKYNLAEILLKETLEFSNNNNSRNNLNSIYEELANLSELKDDYKSALQYYKKYKSISDELYNSETSKKINNLEIIQKTNLLTIERNNAQKMANIKHDFLANMSHEIRTPINSILGICYLLQQQSLNEIQDNYVNRLKRSGENLLGIINDILDISKIESGKMELTNELFSLNEVISDIYNSLEPKVKDKEIQFKIINRYKKKKQLFGDKIRLYQVLLNIVSNAIKFTNKGSVTLLTDCIEIDMENVQLSFTIKDTGIGISKNKIDTIFERYEQADATIKNSFGGTGLGLSISKRIVELMNGTIEIKSKLNKGTEFIISIPFSQVEQFTTSSSSDISIPPEVLNNKLILIADDNEDNRLVAKEILYSYNNTIRIMEASDGNEVISLLFKKIPDILFMDLDMPNLNGIETTQKIRKNKKYDKVKIIGNTASLSTFTNEELSELGFDEFIYKPYKVADFISKMHIK